MDLIFVKLFMLLAMWNMIQQPEASAECEKLEDHPPRLWVDCVSTWTIYVPALLYITDANNDIPEDVIINIPVKLSQILPYHTPDLIIAHLYNKTSEPPWGRCHDKISPNNTIHVYCGEWYRPINAMKYQEKFILDKFEKVSLYAYVSRMSWLRETTTRKLQTGTISITCLLSEEK